MAEPAWLPTLLQALGIGGGGVGGALLFALIDRWFGRRDKALDRRTEEQKQLDALEQQLRKNLLEDLERERRDKALLRQEVKDSNDACDKAYETAARWRRAGRRLDKWTYDQLGLCRNEIQRLASLLRVHAPKVEFKAMEVPQPPMLESLMEPDPQPPAAG